MYNIKLLTLLSTEMAALSLNSKIAITVRNECDSINQDANISIGLVAAVAKSVKNFFASCEKFLQLEQ